MDYYELPQYSNKSYASQELFQTINYSRVGVEIARETGEADYRGNHNSRCSPSRVIRTAEAPLTGHLNSQMPQPMHKFRST